MNTGTKVGTVLVIAALAGGLGGCAPRATPGTLDAELAELREEERALREEMAALRDEIARLSSALEATRVPEIEPPTQRRVTPRPEEPAHRMDPSNGAAIVTVVDSYRRALEAEDLPLLQELYGGELPSADLRYIELWFGRADQLRVDMKPKAIEVLDGNAQAVIDQVITYRLQRTHELRTVTLKVRMYFEQRRGDWRLLHVETRL